MKMTLTLVMLAIAAWIATGRTRCLIRRLGLSEIAAEPYGASWWRQEVRYAKPSAWRDRIGQAIALRFT